MMDDDSQYIRVRYVVEKP